MNFTDNLWVSIYNRQIKNMIGICYRYVGNRQIAEDLAHDAFAKAIDNCDSFKGKGSFDAWLRRIVVNNALSYLRNQKREKKFNDWLNDQHILSESFSDNIKENVRAQDSFSIEELLDAINSLPEHHKLVFNLYVLDKFTHVQIAEELGISSGTSKSHLARARKKLRTLLYQKTIQDKNNKKKNRTLLLLVFPVKLRYVDSVFDSVFENFEMINQNTDFIKSINKGKTFNLKSKPNMFYLKSLILIGFVAVLVTASFLYKNELSITTSNVEKGSVLQKNISKTATFSNDSIIFNSNIKIDTIMRKIKQLGFATVLTASCLAFDTIGQTVPDKKNGDVVFYEKLIASKNSNVSDQAVNNLSKNKDEINNEVINLDVCQNKKNSILYEKTEYPLDFCNIANESFGDISKWEIDLTCCNIKNYYRSNNDVQKNKITTLVYLSLKSLNNKQLSAGTYTYAEDNITTRQQMTLYGRIEIGAEKLDIFGGEIIVDYHEEKIVLSFSFKVNNGKEISGNYIGAYKTVMSKK